MAKKTIKKAIITKDPVIGFVVTKSKSQLDDSDFVVVYPLSINFQGVQNLDIPSDSEIVGILPALPELYKVYGSYETDEILKELGYEFKGAHYPDWTTELKEKVK
ncbi:MAG: hypothetical protein ABOK23_12015 [Candidatus Methanoperedens sp.]|nr:hypothetical protein [Candidatus Methanoperedens sp.]MCZ7395272.1 hypothetical protein [Candidatus Methanoperedens sp.]